MLNCILVFIEFYWLILHVTARFMHINIIEWLCLENEEKSRNFVIL